VDGDGVGRAANYYAPNQMAAVVSGLPWSVGWFFRETKDNFAGIYDQISTVKGPALIKWCFDNI
jgi:hypothetical protein